ncbi:nucleotidyltransferase domain-containing protein [Rossellomorea aquimaris]|uniref:nucleotidyltransferase domain-containing protein n=1 Tax=Rossellomorea aquimaris TaxID=189382 RepID=UPI001CD1BC00|nr:nucleotidyltransferase domain-containing protein [Rossellomorea aquimaris]MCA1054447.1 nucleotidyltransferase domain-containing protein [Rossellomorea aquimaris]
MEQRIRNELDRIEVEYGIIILYAVDAGSRAWGYESDDSDYDIRFIYVHPVRHYLSIQQRRDVIERKEDPFEFVGWDLKKTFFLLYKSNPSILEWLKSDQVFLEHEALQELRMLSEKSFSLFTALNHYHRMAKQNLQLAERRKRPKDYLNVARPLLACEWIETFGTFPPNCINRMMRALALDATLKREIEDLITLKKSGKSEIGDASLFMSCATEGIERVESLLKRKHKQEELEMAAYDDCFITILERVWGHTLPIEHP